MGILVEEIIVEVASLQIQQRDKVINNLCPVCGGKLISTMKDGKAVKNCNSTPCLALEKRSFYSGARLLVD